MLDFKALLFDLDGTLLDTAPDFIAALNKQLKLHGRTPISNDAVRTSVTNGSVGLIQVGFGIDPTDQQFETLREEFLELYFANLADKTVLFDGLQQVLDTCNQQQIPWGIVTNKPWRYTQAVLSQLNLIDQVATVICPDHVNQPKPDPEGMYMACNEIQISPPDCLYIGDHVRDIEAGRAAEMTTIAAAWGYIEAGENIAQWGADYVVNQPQQLHSLLFN